MEKDYYVEFKVTGFWVTDVTAESIEEAKEKAEQLWCDADFGELTDEDCEPIRVTEQGELMPNLILSKDKIVWEV